MLLVLAKQKLIGHSGDVIAHYGMPWFHAGGFLVRGRHGARRIEIVNEEFFETADGAIAVFGDGGVVVNVPEQETASARSCVRQANR